MTQLYLAGVENNNYKPFGPQVGVTWLSNQTMNQKLIHTLCLIYSFLDKILVIVTILIFHAILFFLFTQLNST